MAGEQIGFGDLSASERGDFRVRFVYDASSAPEPQPIEFPKGEPTCMPENLRPISETLLVDPKTMGIKNIVLYPDPKRTNFEAAELVNDSEDDSRKAVIELTVQNCTYQPHVSIVRVGQRLKLNNSDIFGHNPSFLFFANLPESRLQPPGEAYIFQPQLGEPAPTPIQCNIHPWMKAYVLVVDHPFAEVSDEAGQIVVRNLPLGRTMTYRIWHESLGRLTATLVTNRQSLIDVVNNRFELQLDSEESDWGEIRLSPSMLGR
jgi:hypothetical protein